MNPSSRLHTSAFHFFSSNKASPALATVALTPLAVLLGLTVANDGDDIRNDSGCRDKSSARLSKSTFEVSTILATSDAAADWNASKVANRRIDSLNEDESKMASRGSSPPQPTSVESHSNSDSYPAFTPYHNSLLKKYLTRPLWNRLSPLQTSLGTTIEDMIRPGIALPMGAHPPRHIGLLAGDAECYTLFEDLLNPIVEEYHGVKLDGGEWDDPELPKEQHFSKQKYFPHLERLDTDNSSEQDGIIKSGSYQDDDFSEEDEFESVEMAPEVTLSATKRTNSRANLRRHSTIINNPLLVKQEADPDNKYILSTRIRIARSLNGVRFPPTMSRIERRQVLSLIQQCCDNFTSPNLKDGVFLPILEMTSGLNLDLIERHVVFDNPNEWTIASGLGRDWPDGRGLYANVDNLDSQTPDFMIWINEEDHIRLMCLRNGGDIQGVFTTVMAGVRELERELNSRGWEFAFHSKLGYLTACPTNVGTTMRASVHVRLVRLGKLDGFHELCKSLKLEARGKYGETDMQYTGIFDISNAERLGKSEVYLINHMVKGVSKLIDLERKLERGEVIDCKEIVRELSTRKMTQSTRCH